MTAYDYSSRTGILAISWEDFHGLCKALAAAIAPWQPELILPIARAGFYPGTLLAHLLQCEIAPLRLTCRKNDEVVRDHPMWLLEPPPSVRGKRALIVDEISSSGETLTLAKEKVAALGAQEVRCAVLYAHTSGAAVPDYIGLISDALLLNPWDREVWREDRFIFHPEYAEALRLQGIPAEGSLLIQTPSFKIAKGAS